MYGPCGVIKRGSRSMYGLLVEKIFFIINISWRTSAHISTKPIAWPALVRTQSCAFWESPSGTPIYVWSLLEKRSILQKNVSF